MLFVSSADQTGLISSFSPNFINSVIIAAEQFTFPTVPSILACSNDTYIVDVSTVALSAEFMNYINGIINLANPKK